jgi:cytosine deaminase
MAVTTLLLRGGRVLRTGAPHPERLDIAIDSDGRIARLASQLAAVSRAREIDLGGRLVTPGMIDVHQHLDKTRTRGSIPNPDGTLLGAIKAFSQYAKTASREDIMARAERTLAACVARGTVALRTHANLDSDLEMRGVEALIEMRERWRDRVHLQVVAFVTSGAVNGRDVRERLDAAIRAGADVVGGTPAIADDPKAFVDDLFAVAARHGRRLDLHLDEHLDASRQHFDLVIERTRALGMQGRVVVGHCCVLSALPRSDAQRLCDGLAKAGIGTITLPAANLFLQGRDAEMLTPRGLTRVPELRAAGVPVACASDNTQDPFIPSGSGDMVEMARWTFLAGHLASHELRHALEMATTIPARFMGLADSYGVHEGARADLLITDAEDAEDLVASGPLERTVLFGGKVVAGRLA